MNGTTMEETGKNRIGDWKKHEKNGKKSEETEKEKKKTEKIGRHRKKREKK